MLDETDDDATEAADSSAAEPFSDFDSARYVLDEYEFRLEYYRHWHEQIPEEVEFVLDQVQFQDDLGHSKDDDEAQAKDMSLLSASRRKWSQISATPTYINCYPTDQQLDPYAAERTKWALEHEVYNPAKMYRRKRRRAIIGAVVGRVWYMLAEWDRSLKEIVYRTKAPTDVFPCPGWQDVHDPQCPDVIIRDTITVQQARQRARDYGMPEEEVMEIGPDEMTLGSGGNKPSSRIPGMVSLSESSAEGKPGARRKDTVTILIMPCRNDPEQAEMENVGESIPLDRSDHFMRCWECEHETKAHPNAIDPETGEDTGELPDTGEPCPVCAAKAADPTTVPRLQAVRALQPWRTEKRYPNGRWIEVLAESKKCIYDGAWPYEKPNAMGTLRSFPLAQFRIYDDPRYEIPHSDVSWQWNQQALATYMLQWAVDQMRTSGRVVFLPYRGVYDSQGRAWQMNNRLDQIAFVKDPMMANAVKEFQPSGLPASWNTLYSQLTSSFRGNLGTGELGLGPDQSKDLPVGTVHAIIESGDVPVDDATSMIRDEEGLFLGVIADMVQCCWDQARWIRYLGKDGQFAYEYVSGADVTGVDVTITGDPAFDILQASKLDRMKVWFTMTPPQRRLAARFLNLEPTQIAQYEQDEQQFMSGQKPLPPQPDKLLTALAALAKAMPGALTPMQVQAALAMAGLPAGQPGMAGPGGPPPIMSAPMGGPAAAAKFLATSLSGQQRNERPYPAVPGTNLSMGGLDSLSPALQQGLRGMVSAQ